MRQVSVAGMGKIASPDAAVSQCKVSSIKLLYANADKADYAMLRLTELAYKCMIVRAAGQLLTPVSVGCAEEIEKTTRAGGKSGDNWLGVNKHLKSSVDQRVVSIGNRDVVAGKKKVSMLTEKDLKHIVETAWKQVEKEPSSGCQRVLRAKAMGEAAWKGDPNDRKNRLRIYIENRWSCPFNVAAKQGIMVAAAKAIVDAAATKAIMDAAASP